MGTSESFMHSSIAPFSAFVLGFITEHDTTWAVCLQDCIVAIHFRADSDYAFVLSSCGFVLIQRAGLELLGCHLNPNRRGSTEKEMRKLGKRAVIHVKNCSVHKGPR